MNAVNSKSARTASVKLSGIVNAPSVTQNVQSAKRLKLKSSRWSQRRCLARARNLM